MIHDYIEIDADDVPYEQLLEIDGNDYYFLIQWNDICRQYVIDLRDVDNNPIVLGEPLILNQPLWRNINNNRLPSTTLIPIDESNQEDEINPGNLGKTVQLCLDNLGDDDNS